MRLLIEGIGGIGGVVAAKVIEAGHDPVLVTNNTAITSAINKNGLQVKTPQGDLRVAANAYTTLAALPRDSSFDAALLIMKATQVVEAAEASLPLLGPAGYVVTFQNGIVEDAIAAIDGPERIISAIIAWGGTMHAPGIYEKTSRGQTILGELGGRETERIHKLAALLNPAAPVRISRNMRGALWAKLAINCTITTIGALTGDLLGEMMRERRVRQVFAAAYREVVDTAEASGVTPERVAANPKLLYLPADANALVEWGKDLALRLVGRRYGGLKSSMLQSLERGRKSEIDFLNGYVVEQAAKVGISVPVNAALVTMIKSIERGERPIVRANMDDLLAAIQ